MSIENKPTLKTSNVDSRYRPSDRIPKYQKGTSAEAKRLKQRLDEASEPFSTTIITVEEVMRGWMAVIRRTADPFRQINAYSKLRRLFQFFATWNVLDWTPAAAAEFRELKAAKTKVGTMDLKIACVALSNNATLLSRNLNDFENVPDLQVVDWLS